MTYNGTVHADDVAITKADLISGWLASQGITPASPQWQEKQEEAEKFFQFYSQEWGLSVMRAVAGWLRSQGADAALVTGLLEKTQQEAESYGLGHL